MSDPELVSIVIPCHNQARFLREAIVSSFAQSYQNREIIVVDDGSIDETVKVAASFGTVRCLSQPNRGLADARNAGLRAAYGSYVLFLDADDRLHTEAIQAGMSCLRDNPECAFAYGYVNLISSDGLTLPTPGQFPIERDHYVELLRHNYIWTSGAVLYRRRVFDAVGEFDPSVAGSADFDLNARVTRLFPICCTGTVFVDYRRHCDSMSRDYSLMLKSAITSRRRQWRFVRGNETRKSALRAGIRAVQEDYGEKLIDHTRVCVGEHRWRKAISDAVILLSYYRRGVLKHMSRKLRNNFLIPSSNASVHED